MNLVFNRHLTRLVGLSDFVLGEAPLRNICSFLGIFFLCIGVTQISKENPYPSYWALYPVVGALLVILGGASAWPNRLLLSNKIAVWFGLISYPLYLWHWPILSFLHILEGGTPQWELRISAIILSILLAWLTFQFVEDYFRRKMRPSHSVFSLVFMLAAVGAFGGYVEATRGAPYRLEQFVNEKADFFAQLNSAGKIRETKKCRTYFDNFENGLCVLEKDDQPTVLLFGDSHALHLYEGLSKSLPNEVVAMIGGGWGGKYGRALSPFLDSEHDLSKSAYDAISAQKGLKTIILAHNNYAHNYKFVETFDYFTSLGLNVVYVVGGPKVGHDLTSCFDSRPLRLYEKSEDACTTDVVDALGPMKRYLENANKALAQRPSVKAFRVSDLLCDSEKCFGKKNGKLMYSNGGKNPHLSTYGSNYVGGALGAYLVKEGLAGPIYVSLR